MDISWWVRDFEALYRMMQVDKLSMNLAAKDDQRDQVILCGRQTKGKFGCEDD